MDSFDYLIPANLSTFEKKIREAVASVSPDKIIDTRRELHLQPDPPENCHFPKNWQKSRPRFSGGTALQVLIIMSGDTDATAS